MRTFRLGPRLLVPAGVLLLVGLVLISGADRRSPLQTYLASLQAEGEKLTCEQLNRGLGPGSHCVPDAISNSISVLGSLSLQPSSYGLVHYVRPGVEQVAWAQPQPPGGPGPRDGQRPAWETVSQVMTQAEGTLEVLRQVLQTNGPDWELRSNPFTPLAVSFAAIRAVAQWLNAAAVVELHERRPEAALQEIEELAALARANRSDFTPVGQMIRVAVAGLGLGTTWQALQLEGWSDAQLERMQRAWETLDLLEAAEAGLLGDRAMGIELWERARRSNRRQFRQLLFGGAAPARNWATWTEDYVIFQGYKLAGLNRDERFFLECMGESIEVVRALRRHEPWDGGRWLTNSHVMLLSRPRASDRFLHLISLRMMPNFTRAIQVSLRNETQRQLTLAAIAIQRYQLRHHVPPPNLGALSPEFLQPPAYDPMSGKTLGYHPGTNGEWVLFSVGEDLVDNGGDPGVTSTNQPGLWEGRDAVWPKPEGSDSGK